MLVSRKLLSTALVAAAAFGLAACGPDNSSDQAGGGSSSAATAAPTGAPATGAPATGAPAASPSGKAKPTAKPSAGATDDGPEGFCTHDPLPAGQKWIVPVKGTNGTTLVYKDTKDACGVDDVALEPTGPDKTAQFAPTFKAQLRSVVKPPMDANAETLAKHVNECIATPRSDKGVYPCQDNVFKVTLDASGKVVEMWEKAVS
ncbi:hypothetical protein PUR71_22950 [Streptomyces sp. SP17BM10]|uniref:hypothetical protein n=1 Tax=Streptomyces sp. SP17BM10 TaxID=3002530 RepID=UPI002E77B7DD|nr:hypothetical protein [Streptomyces sp. SP17BM10]MEE1785739.1 hypothetical protein [Streptomyces sp. SP17BM10]